MFDFSAGYHAVWDDSYGRPVDNPPPREFPGGHPLYDADEWYRGYDAGKRMSACYRRGYETGLLGCPKGANPYPGGYYENDSHAWVHGWRDGYTTRLKKLLRPLLPKKLGLVKVTVWYPDYDHCTGEHYEGGEKYERVGKREFLSSVIDEVIRHGGTPTTLKEMVSAYEAHEEGDGSFCQVRVIPAKEAKREQAEAEYRRMEEAAQAFSARCNHELGTKQFILALEKAVRQVRDERESWNNPERRHEEWAAHMFAGSREAYFDDLNFENGRYDGRMATLEEVWRYMERKFPLTMMRYRERRKK